MLARVFRPTETKKNGPARSPASAPARRSSLTFTAAPGCCWPPKTMAMDEAEPTTTRRCGHRGSTVPRVGIPASQHRESRP
jgi:hypothetical protein